MIWRAFALPVAGLLVFGTVCAAGGFFVGLRKADAA